MQLFRKLASNIKSLASVKLLVMKMENVNNEQLITQGVLTELTWSQNIDEKNMHVF